VATIKTLDGQNVWDLTIRNFGSTEDLGEIVSQFTTINIAIPAFTELEITENNNNIVSLFEINNTQVATGEQEVPPGGAPLGFDYEFDFGLN